MVIVDFYLFMSVTNLYIKKKQARSTKLEEKDKNLWMAIEGWIMQNEKSLSSVCLKEYLHLHPGISPYTCIFNFPCTYPSFEEWI